jgi:hypothetical protein
MSARVGVNYQSKFYGNPEGWFHGGFVQGVPRETKSSYRSSYFFELMSQSGIINC